MKKATVSQRKKYCRTLDLKVINFYFKDETQAQSKFWEFSHFQQFLILVALTKFFLPQTLAIASPWTIFTILIFPVLLWFSCLKKCFLILKWHWTNVCKSHFANFSYHLGRSSPKSCNVYDLNTLIQGRIFSKLQINK